MHNFATAYYICSAHKLLLMEETKKKSRTIYYLLAFVSIVAMFAMFQFKPEWSWVTFPFVGTFVAVSLDVL